MNLNNKVFNRRILGYTLAGIIILTGIPLAIYFIGHQQPYEKINNPTIKDELTTEDEVKIKKTILENNLSKINLSEVRLTNIRKSDDWLFATIYTTDPTVEPGIVVLKKNKSKWTLIYGPAPDIDDSQLAKLGSPTSLIRLFTTLYKE